MKYNKRIQPNELADAMEKLGTFTIRDIMREIALTTGKIATRASMRNRLARMEKAKKISAVPSGYISKYTATKLQLNRIRDQFYLSQKKKKEDPGWRPGMIGKAGTTVIIKGV